MSGLQIEGDLSQINEPQLEYIKSVLESKGFKDNKVVIQPVGQAGDNYVANVKRISVDDGKGGTFKMVAKVAPQQEMMRIMASTEQLFRNEHIMYTKVLPKYTELEKGADISPQERLKYATCFGSFSEAPNEVILLEDLNESKFTMLNRLEPIKSECIKLVLKDFAKLHSLAYVLKNKEPEVYEGYKNSLFDMWSALESQEEAIVYFKQMEIGISMILESDIHKKYVSNAISQALSLYPKISIPDKNSKHSIIQQGDAWTNNIMFQFDGEALTDAIMIDYQVSKAGNPAVDILYLIFNCTDYESRKENFTDWLDYYHSELDKALSNHGLKANYIYSRDQLDADLKRYGKLGLGQAILLAGILSMKSDEAGAMKQAMEDNDVDKMIESTSAVSKDMETINLIKKRVEGIVDSFLELGLL